MQSAASASLYADTAKMEHGGHLQVSLLDVKQDWTVYVQV